MPEDIMKYDRILPEDFDGVFRFTNWSDEDFVAKWGGKEYLYSANKTSAMIIPEHSPVEIQNIRKKFAKDLAEREFFKSDKYKVFLKQERNDDGSPRLNSIYQGGQYSMDDLTSFIQRALEPLAIAKAIVTEVAKDNLEEKLSRDEEGDLNTMAIDSKTSLKDKAFKNEKLSK